MHAHTQPATEFLEATLLGRRIVVDLVTGHAAFVPSGGAPDPAPAADPGGAPAGSDPARPNGGGELMSPDRVDWDKLDLKNIPAPLQKIINHVAGNNRKNMQEELASTKGQLDTATGEIGTLRDKLASVEEAIAALKDPPPPDKKPEDPEFVPAALRTHPHLAAAYVEFRKDGLTQKQAYAAMAEETKGLKKQLEDALTESKAEREKRAEADKRLLGIRRDREALGILSALNVIDPRREVALYAGRLEYQESTDSFLYRRGDELVDPTEGIKGDLPDYVIRPDNTTGGSGARGHGGAGADKPESSADQLTRLTQEFGELRAKTRQGERLTEMEKTRLLQLGPEIEALKKAPTK